MKLERKDQNGQRSRHSSYGTGHGGALEQGDYEANTDGFFLLQDSPAAKLTTKVQTTDIQVPSTYGLSKY